LIFDIGDYVKFIGIIKTTQITPLYMFSYLTEYKKYKILNIIDLYDDNKYYHIYHDHYSLLWYPIENFDICSEKELMSRRYDLR